MIDINLLRSRLVELMEKELNLIVPSVNTDLFEMGGLDSLIFVDLIMLLEREFGLKVDIQNIELNDFKSVASISEFICRQLHAEDINEQKYAQIPGRMY